VIEIDGSFGEGGGQILRTSLTLSVLTGRPFKMRNIRAKRKNPGLQHQHLSAVRVMKLLAKAKVRGDFLGSTELEFVPGEVQEGNYSLDVGTAGSVVLIAMTALPVILNRNVRLTLRGGTDVPLSPPVDYMRLVYLPILEKMGMRAELRVSRRGHYPQGGGEIVLENVRGNPTPLSLTEMGEATKFVGVSHVSSLPGDIARRQADSARRHLEKFGKPVHIELEIDEVGSKGSGIVVVAVGDSLMGGSALGERGVMAEIVGERAAEQLLQDMSSGGALDRHMSDMLMVLCALNNLRYTGAQLTEHAKTNLEVIRKFLNVNITLRGERPFFLECKTEGT
jgi:RNA 3'-terminal phosphate cyclase (ATP)